MFSATAKATETPATQKSVLAKSRDYIHQTVATEDQLMDEKPFSEQVKAKIPADTTEAAEKLDSTVSAMYNDVKEKFNERIDEGTKRMEKHEKDDGNTSSGGIKQKIYEATKSPEVKAREEFRQKPLMEKVSLLANNETRENVSEIFAS